MGPIALYGPIRSSRFRAKYMVSGPIMIAIKIDYCIMVVKLASAVVWGYWLDSYIPLKFGKSADVY